MSQEVVKHVVDATVIPSGVTAAVIQSLGLITIMDTVNTGLAFIVLLTSAVWGIYRLVTILEDRREKKRDKKH